MLQFQYESGQKKREEKIQVTNVPKEHRFDGPLRRETWIHPDGGRRIHRTAPLKPTNLSYMCSDDEELSQVDSIEVRSLLFCIPIYDLITIVDRFS